MWSYLFKSYYVVILNIGLKTLGNNNPIITFKLTFCVYNGVLELSTNIKVIYKKLMLHFNNLETH